ncbi:hypothetical protein PZQ55_002161 [Clostridium botulinum]|uniref:Lipoprotein n=1 Tax=Clostridium botulinum TaxID=1491 RepID=A0ABC8CY60_CLOBO|nr:lipoprotein BA_5634 family protein [Clostridium botulinum]AVQ39192.1 hypothetical protein C7M56_11050 [Clostridium botulinum]EKO1913100.1 hypothetical protein [Clostridium botulinum]EKO2043161.1 hypothetical protein [Clostridium botulinum]
MKKKILIIAIIVAVIGAAAFGYKAVFGKKEIPANGLLMIGNDKEVNSIEERYKSDTKIANKYKIKTAVINKEKALILSKSTGNELIKKGILEEKDGDFAFGTPIDEMPNVSKDEAIIFEAIIFNNETKCSDMKEIAISNDKFKVGFYNKAWIGRYIDKLAKFIIIVDDDKFNKISATETNMDVLEFKKSFGDTDRTASGEYKKTRHYKENIELERLYPKMQGFKFVTVEKTK